MEKNILNFKAKEEIAKRYNSGYPPVREFLEQEGYLDYLALLKGNAKLPLSSRGFPLHTRTAPILSKYFKS